jgi:hypothetical protein
LLLPPLLEFLKDSDREIYDEIIAIKTDHVSIELAVEMLQTDAVRQKIAEFKATSNRDPSLVFWMSYLDMVSTLLMFTCAERDGIYMLFDVCFRSFSDTTILTTQDGEQSILQIQLSYLLKSCRNFEQETLL